MQKHLLIVDDDAGVRSVIGDMLEDEGYRVNLVPDGPEMRNFLADDPSVDAIILDLILPGESGAKLAIFAQTLKLPVILITGSETGRGFAEALHVELLRKPFKSDELFKAVARAVEMHDA